jgi:hypothetical protein
MTNAAPPTVTVELGNLKPGKVIRYHQTQYKAWRVVPVDHLGGLVLLASRHDGHGWKRDAVALYFANQHAVVEVLT